MTYYDTVFLGLCITQILTFILILVSKRRSVRRIATYLTTPIFLTCYLITVALYCIQHSDEHFFDVVRDKATSFSAVVNTFTEERWL